MNRQNAASLLQPLTYCRTELWTPEGLHNEIMKILYLTKSRNALGDGGEMVEHLWAPAPLPESLNLGNLVRNRLQQQLQLLKNKWNIVVRRKLGRVWMILIPDSNPTEWTLRIWKNLRFYVKNAKYFFLNFPAAEEARKPSRYCTKPVSSTFFKTDKKAGNFAFLYTDQIQVHNL